MKELKNRTYLFITMSSSTRWRQTVGVNLVPKGGTNTTVLFSSKGARTKEPLQRTTPSSTTANSTIIATTKQKLEKTTIAYYFGVLHHLMPVQSITKTLLYIGMGVDGDFPQAPSGYFLPSPWWTRYLQETPRAHTKAY
jgi:hypothetical protein